jgi:hypothetical protein
VREIEIRFPIRIDCPDVAPIRPTFNHVDARIDEAMPVHGAAFANQIRNDVLAEVVRGLRVAGIANQPIEQE